MWGFLLHSDHPGFCRLPGEELCWGDSHEYRECQLPVGPRIYPESLLLGFAHPKFSLLVCLSTFIFTQDCPPGATPFRDLQCSLYNGHPVLGTQKTYQWVPFHGGE